MNKLINPLILTVSPFQVRFHIRGEQKFSKLQIKFCPSSNFYYFLYNFGTNLDQ